MTTCHFAASPPNTWNTLPCFKFQISLLHVTETFLQFYEMLFPLFLIIKDITSTHKTIMLQTYLVRNHILDANNKYSYFLNVDK